MKASLTTAAAVAVVCLTVAGDDNVSSITNVAPVGAKGKSETVQAKVVKAFVVEDNGAKFRAYQVQWKGSDVIISDMLAKTDKNEGDLLTFRVNRTQPGKGRPPSLYFHTTGGSTIIHIPYGRASGSTSTNELTAGAKGNPETVQAKVIKVFAVEDNGAKFRAYQVRWKGFDIVVSDTLADTGAKEGVWLTFLASRSFGMAPPTFHFTTMRGYRAK
jgi:hypothetical protein